MLMIDQIRGWRWLFIVEGAATVGWALISYFLLLDFPANTKKLTARERELAISRLEADDVTGRNEDTPRLTSIQALKQSLSSWRMWLLTAGYMVIVGSSTLSYFYPTLVQGLGYTRYVLGPENQKQNPVLTREHQSYGAVHGSADICCGFRGSSLYLLLLGQVSKGSWYDYRCLAGPFDGLLCHRLRRIQLHGAVYPACVHGDGTLGHKRSVFELCFEHIWLHASRNSSRVAGIGQCSGKPSEFSCPYIRSALADSSNRPKYTVHICSRQMMPQSTSWDLA